VEKQMLISEYLNNKKLKPVEQAAIEDKENFETHLRAAEQILFGSLPPVVYSNVKKFNKGPVFGNQQLNRQGLHIFRYAFATYAAKHRTKVPEFLTNGHVRLENFLPDEHHKRVQQECMKYPIAISKEGFNNCNNESKTNPGIDFLFNHSEMKEKILDCIGIYTGEAQALYNQNTFIQRVENAPNDNDEQKDIHSDIFFPAVKWWYFPDSVELGQGPFRFQTSKPVIDQKLLDWLYNESIKLSIGKWDRTKLRGHIEGSLRATDNELQQLGITVSPITVKANTLVIANVQLFHGRGDTTQPHTRNAIHGSIRVKHPFVV